MLMLICALAMGAVAGLRTMTAPAAVAWAAHLGVLPVADTWLAFLGYAWTPWILTLMALGEYAADKWPSTPSRTVPVQFAGRVLSGAFCGAAIGTAGASMAAGAAAGVLGAVIGTLGGRAARGRLAAAFGRDLPAALLEDAVAIGAAALIARTLA
jgi:uncharacterized membrane protein